MFNLFTPTSPDKVAEEQLYEARRQLLEHQAAAEYHKAMEDMLESRINRLTFHIANVKDDKARGVYAVGTDKPEQLQ